MSSFQYQPLGVGQIRILRVLPGYQEDGLKGELSAVSIDDTAQCFDALSYMWGDPAPADTIELSAQPLPIASNLAVALRYLRYVDKPLVIWIDAICINQEDLDERSRQVQLMRQLYSRAEVVRIWINEPHVDSQSDAVQALQNFDSVSKTADDLWHGFGPDPSFWDPVAPLFRNRYWGRAWIQQEVLNAKITCLHCYNILISGSSITMFQESLSDRHSAVYGSSAPSDVTWAEHLTPFLYHFSPATHASLHKNGSYTLDQLLFIHAPELEVSDPRDRVYALMHLAAGYEDGQIVVDYSKSLISVAIDAASCHVRSYHNVRFLMTARLVQTGEDQRSDLTLQHQAPTWLPLEWYGDVSPNAKCLIITPVDRNTSCRPDSINVQSQRLHLRGFRIDYVRRCLSRGVDTWQATPRQFCNSLLGYYLRVYAGVGMENLSTDVFKVLLWTDDVVLRNFCQMLEHDFMGEQAGSLPIEADLDDEDLIMIMHEATISSLAMLFDLNHNAHTADQFILSHGRLNRDLIQNVDLATRVATYLIVDELVDRLIIMTNDKLLAKVPNCAIRDGDEIWMVLGCPLPIVVRPQPNGAYIHICAAMMPSIQEDELIKGLSSDIQPGDRVGKWLVEDIKLE